MSGLSGIGAAMSSSSDVLLAAASKASNDKVNAARAAASGLADTAVSQTNAQAMQMIDQMTSTMIDFTA